MFGSTFRNFVFVSVGTVDAGNFKGAAELEALRTHTADEAERYAAWARTHGYGAETFTAIGHDVTGEIMTLASAAREKISQQRLLCGPVALHA